MRSLALTFLLVAAPAFAQVRPNNFLLEDTTILAGTAGQFEPTQHQYCAALVKSGAPSCLVFSTALFGDPNRYLTLVPFASFAHFDQGKYAASGLTLEEEHALSLNPGAATRQSALTMDRELSFIHTTNAAMPLNRFMEIRLRPGALDTFLSTVRSTLLPAARKFNAPAFEVFTTSAGDSPDRVLIVTRLDGFAQLDHAAALFESSAWIDFLAKYVAGVETYVMRYRPDISANPTDPAQ